MHGVRFLRAAFAMALAAAPGWAQSTSTASIVGTVRDASGAFIPEATVSAVNVQTGLTVTRPTSQEGYYSLPLLPSGRYRLEVSKEGFQRWVQTDIPLAVNNIVTIHVSLSLGALTESVSVVAQTPLLETQTGTIRGVVDQQRIIDLPLNGRDITQLVAIQAGVIPRGGSSGEGNAYAVNGSRGNGVYFLMDSGMNTDSYRNYSGLFPNPDAIQEFSIQKSNFSAEYANATGAVVSVVTRGGTNQVHGSLFHFLRTYGLNARNFFAARRDSLKRNQFGGTVGGPIVKDKLFYFFSYQGTTLRSDPGLTRQFLPTAAMRQGDFSSVTRAIIDPDTGRAFPNNQIPAGRLSPVTLNLLKHIPVPQTPTGERFIGIPERPDEHEYTFRGDYNLGSHRFSGRYFRRRLTRPFAGNVEDLASMFAATAGKSTQPYNQLTVNHAYTISPALLNSLTVAYRWRRTFNDWTAVKLPIDFARAGVKGIAVREPPSVVVSVSGAFTARPGWIYDKVDDDWHLYDSAGYVRGRHELKFGGEYLRTTNDIANHFRTMGNFDFNGSLSGNAMADFMLGEVYRFWQGGGEFKDLTGHRFGFFAQDNFRARPNLTFNLGLRWDPSLPFTDSLGRVQCFVPGVRSTRFPKAPPAYLNVGDPSCPEGGFPSYWRSLSPRLGFAWSPFDAGKTVLRGAYGLFWNPQFTILYNGFVNSAPFSPQVVRFGVDFHDPYASAENPFPASFAPFNPPRDAEFFLPLGQFGAFSPDFRPSYMQTFNFTLEREVVRNMVARASYVANLGRRLSYNLDVNYARFVPGQSTTANIQDRRPYRDFGTILVAEAGSTSSYHGLQLSLERRVTENFSFEANYTWSKTIDDVSEDTTPGQSSSIASPLSREANRGLADFDIPHRFVMSYVWALPQLRDSSGLVRALLGGWETTGIVTLSSGTPFTVRSGADRAFSGINLDYADLAGEPRLDTGRPTHELIARYFNPAAFALNQTGTFGTSPRSVLRGPGRVNFDLGMMKEFALRERLRLQLRGEAFNAFNRVNFGHPFSQVNVPARFGRIESAGDPRIMQLALKLRF